MNRTLRWSIIVCCVLLMMAVTMTGCEIDPVEKRARKQAESLYYGKHTEIDLAIQYEANAVGWNFILQGGQGHLIETENKDIPFLITLRTTFKHPTNGTTRHLRQTYLYDVISGAWVPLIATVWNYKAENVEFLKVHRVWQGDYDVFRK